MQLPNRAVVPDQEAELPSQTTGEAANLPAPPLPQLVGRADMEITPSKRFVGVFCFSGGVFVLATVWFVLIHTGSVNSIQSIGAIAFVGGVGLLMLKLGWDYWNGK